MNTSNLNHVLASRLIDVRQAALMFNLPSYLLQAKERQERRIPHYRVGKLVPSNPTSWKSLDRRAADVTRGWCRCLISMTHHHREKRAGATSMTASGTRFALN